eukprot:7204325-Karenia_brevis.AAC.1
MRSIDHFSWTPHKNGKQDSVNGHVSPGEKFKHHTLDQLADAMRLFHDKLNEVPGLFKADVESAFRRVPVCPGDRWACAVAWKTHDQAAWEPNVSL